MATQQIEFGIIMVHDACGHVGSIQPRFNFVIKFARVSIWLLHGVRKWVMHLTNLTNEIYMQCNIWTSVIVDNIIHSRNWSDTMRTWHNHWLKLKCLIIHTNILLSTFHILCMQKEELIVCCWRETLSEI